MLGSVLFWKLPNLQVDLWVWQFSKQNGTLFGTKTKPRFFNGTFLCTPVVLITPNLFHRHQEWRRIHVAEFQTAPFWCWFRLVREKTALAAAASSVVSHLLVPSSCRLQLTLFASLAHDATTRRTRLDIGEGDGVVVPLTQPNLTQPNLKPD